MRRHQAALLIALFGIWECSGFEIRGAPDPKTLNGKVLLGYQGWFDCPAEGVAGSAWRSWFRGPPSAQSLAVDLYPDLSEFSQRDLCAMPGFTLKDGPAYLYSARNSAIVERHFEWMQDYDLDGVLVQRFVSNIQRNRAGGDVVLKNIVASAGHSGRVFAIEYDVTGADAATLFEMLQEDWHYLVEDVKITSTHTYLRHNGKPVLSIWGMGLAEDRNPPSDPAAALRVISWFQSQAPKPQRATLIGGVPARWRTRDRDSRPDDGWENVYAAFDVVQPWTVGRYKDQAGADTWRSERIEPDLESIRKSHQLYMPVVFPGFSWHNLKKTAPLNQIKRNGGKFLWRQAYNARSAGATMLKIAMFDEVNEGTAVFKAATGPDSVPRPGEWLTLGADQLKLPSDWYLRISGAITRMFRAPVSSLTADDAWVRWCCESSPTCTRCSR